MELDQCLNFVLTKAQQSVHQLFKAELIPHGVTPGQYSVLKCLWKDNGQTVKQLAEHLYLDSSTVTGILDRMEQKGLIKKTADPKDRRALQVLLTEKGQALEEPLSQAILNANKKALQEMNDKEYESLKELLHKLSPGN
ncbi:MarR family winged helix-turn-helix transcriptional regulator [Syntrophomonas wolfei]|uniref:Transcriptional regulator, MarR family n=1 Tax=Syntrophomonas wolfei subsp. wolfei (strain DSM 2245B / Goettingen) TaxID=335541 RepID=Q0B087_SYNWW|nr:MarR family transcriptional regulator [Syntrophomonas wolfei]ABI67617.1 transcriptional regulator, MarR family [Syntrophomonas wolfei subsp. wolfei str. Goettingen G311]